MGIFVEIFVGAFLAGLAVGLIAWAADSKMHAPPAAARCCAA